jgi:hypothetical protein
VTQHDTATGSSGPPLPSGGPEVRWWWLFGAPLLAVLVVAVGAVALVVATGDSEAGDAHPMEAAAPLELASVTADVAAHYRYAEAHQAELSAIPCFCGCQEFLAHESLYDCFVRVDGAGYDSHAAGCGVCIGEAVLASQLLEAGTPVADVAARIVEEFGTTPITSPDQTIPRP